MKHIHITTLTTLLICLTSCVSEKLELQHKTDLLTVTATQLTDGDAATRTTLTPNAEGIRAVWAENDKIRIMQANAGAYTAVDLLLKEGSGSPTATFEGNNFPETPEASDLKYQAFYPADIEGNTPEIWKRNATYEGQIQKGNDNTDHLAAFDYLTTEQTDNIGQALKFRHSGLIFCFEITMPETESTPKSLMLTTVDGGNSPTAEGGLFKNCNQEKTASITLNFQELHTTTPTFKAYLMCRCNIPTKQKIAVVLTLKDGSTYSSQLTAQQTISSTNPDSHNEGINYVVPISEWIGTKNSVFNAATKAEKYSGSGTQDDPYIIESAENMKYLAEEDNAFSGKYFSLTTDITIEEGTTWTPIGTKTAFRGHFNGNGHTIQGVLKAGSATYLGVFGTTKYATISNLNSHVNITEKTCEFIGGIVAYADNTTITNCHYDGTITIESGNIGTAAGGISGYGHENFRIEECSTRGTIQQNSSIRTEDLCIGGILAKAKGFIMTRCTNYAELRSDKNDSMYGVSTGGLIGRINTDPKGGKIEDCHNYGEIFGGTYVSYKSSNAYCCQGGIVGQALNVNISRTYNHATIHSQYNEHSNYTGGLFGYLMNSGESSFNECANYGEVIGNANSKCKSYTGGLVGNSPADKCTIHKCHNAGNISVVTNTPENKNIYIGSYIGIASPSTKVYDCCTTAAEVIIKGANGETIATTDPNFYIGNGTPLIKCPDGHAKQND